VFVQFSGDTPVCRTEQVWETSKDSRGGCLHLFAENRSPLEKGNPKEMQTKGIPPSLPGKTKCP